MKARFFALAALVLGLASCQQEFNGAATQVGGEVDFQLKVDAKELATRADGDLDEDGRKGYNSAYGAIDYLENDWDKVDLRYTLEVYDVANGAIVGTTPVKDRMVEIVDEYAPVVFDLRLVPNREYRFVVFADIVEENASEVPTVAAQAEIGLHHTIGSTLQEITIKDDKINEECTDAYFATKDILVSNSKAEDLVLRRPYGKVRVIATDLHELNLNVEAAYVKVTYSAPNANVFNAVTGTISGEGGTVFKSKYADCDQYTAGYDSYTNTALNGTVRQSHKTLSTDYILATEDQEPIHFEITVYDKDKKEIKTTNFSTDIPVKRNHLTTIVGNVLTTATEINVSIDDNFEGEEYFKDMVLVNTAKELKEALNAYVDGQTILFDADIKAEETITIVQKEGVNVVIDGNGYKFDGSFLVNGDSRSAGTETLTFQNIKFRTDGSDFTFITAPSKIDGKYNYSHNVTIKNCTFVANETVGCASFTGAYNIVMEDCVAKNVHSIAQFQSIDNTVVVKDIKVTESKSGLAFGNTAFAILKNAKIDVAEYGVRADGDASRGKLDMTDVNIKASVPVVIRYVTTAGYTVNIDDTNTLEGIGYDVIFTQNKDDKTYVAPAVEFIANVAEGIEVFPGEKMYAYDAEMLQAFINNAKDGDVIEIVKDIEGDVTVAQKADVKITIDGNNHDYKGVIVVDGKSAAYATAGLTIKNLKFNADTISADACIRLGDSTNATRYTNNVTVEGCTFNVPGAVGVKSYTGGDKNLKLYDCTATAVAHSLLQVANVEESVEVKDCEVYSKNGLNFNSSANVVIDNLTADVLGYAVRFGANSANGVAEAYTITNSTLKSACKESDDAVIILRGCADKAVLTLKNTTIEGPRQIINNVEGAEVSVDGVSAITSAEALNAALLNGGTITLGSNVEGTFTVAKNVELIGVNGATITGRVEIRSVNATFENVNFDRNETDSNNAMQTASNALQYKAVVMIYGDQTNTIKFDGCKFYNNNGTHKSAITNVACDLIVDNCYFEGWSSSIYSQCNLSITNSTFNYTGGNNVIASINGCGAAGGKFIFKDNTITNKIFVLAQFLSTVGFGDGTYHFDVQGNTGAGFDNYFFNTNKVANKTFAEGSETF